jgi:hypothetical protein
LVPPHLVHLLEGSLDPLLRKLDGVAVLMAVRRHLVQPGQQQRVLGHALNRNLEGRKRKPVMTGGSRNRKRHCDAFKIATGGCKSWIKFRGFVLARTEAPCLCPSSRYTEAQLSNGSARSRYEREPVSLLGSLWWERDGRDRQRKIKEKKRERKREREWDRESEREWERVRVRESEREWEWEWERVRVRVRESERERVCLSGQHTNLSILVQNNCANQCKSVVNM